MLVEAEGSGMWREACSQLSRVLRKASQSMDDDTVAQLAELRSSVLVRIFFRGLVVRAGFIVGVLTRK